MRWSVVTGMAFLVVTSLGRKVATRWSSMPPGALLPTWVGTETCGGFDARPSRIRHRSAAERWLNAAPTPEASTAASHDPSLDRSLRPTAKTLG